MSLRIGLDSMLIVEKSVVGENEYQEIMTISSSTATPVRFISTFISSNIPLGRNLNIIYRSLLSSVWQHYPLGLCVFIDFKLPYTKKSTLYDALYIMADVTLSNLIIVRSVNDFRAFTSNYPRPVLTPIDPVNLTPYLSNAIRERMLLAMVNVARTSQSSSLRIIGWNDFEALLALELGFDLEVYDVGYVEPTPPLLSDFYNSEQSTVGDSDVYVPPDIIKLRFLHALMWSYVSYDLIYIGAAPGVTLARTLLLRQRMKGSVWLLDPKFDMKSSLTRTLKELGFNVIAARFRYSGSDCFPLDRCTSPHLVFNDDAYMVRSKQWDFTLSKIKYYGDLIAARASRGLRTVVILKFQPNSMNDNAIKVEYLKDVVFQPGVNDSLELRLLLSDDGTVTTLNKSALINSSVHWRKRSLRDQLNIVSLYFSHIIKRDNALFSTYRGNTLASYSLTSASPTNYKGIQAWRGVIQSYHQSQYTFAFTLPPNVITDKSGDVILTNWKERHYVDISVTNEELWLMPAFAVSPMSLNVDYKYTTVYSLHRALIGKSDLKTLPMCMFAGSFVNEVVPQSARSSPGPLIKCFTLGLRLERLLPNNFTYQTRLRFLMQLTDVESLKVSLVGEGDVTFISLISQKLYVKSGPLKGKILLLHPMQRVAVSGHLLNVILSARFGLDIIKLWLMQWRAQSQLSNNDSSYNENYVKRLSLYHKRGLLYDYNPDGTVGIYDEWHSFADVFLALVIANSYLQAFDLPAFTDEGIRALYTQM